MRDYVIFRCFQKNLISVPAKKNATLYGVLDNKKSELIPSITNINSELYELGDFDYYQHFFEGLSKDENVIVVIPQYLTNRYIRVEDFHQKKITNRLYEITFHIPIADIKIAIVEIIYSDGTKTSQDKIDITTKENQTHVRFSLHSPPKSISIAEIYVG